MQTGKFLYITCPWECKPCTSFTLYDSWQTVAETVCTIVAQCEYYVQQGQTVCPTVCRSVHTMQLLHRQLDKLSHVVFTLCDGLSNSFSRLNAWRNQPYRFHCWLP